MNKHEANKILSDIVADLESGETCKEWLEPELSNLLKVIENSEPQSQATNTVHDAIALLKKLKHHLDLREVNSIESGCDLHKEINAVLTQQHHA